MIYFACTLNKRCIIFKYYFFSLSSLHLASSSSSQVIAIVPLTSICASLKSHKPELSIEVVDLI